MKQKITPHLWFDKEAKEATAFYVTLFSAKGGSASGGQVPFDSVQGESKINNITTITGTPSGDCDIVTFELSGQEFMAISAGPYFKLNPSISFFVTFDNETEIEAVWNKLILGGKALMPYDTYPWARKYGWLQDKYGLSWQLSWSEHHEMKQKITPMLMFTNNVVGKTKEAIETYTSIFPNSKVEMMVLYAKDDGDQEGLIKHSRFTLDGQNFMAMDSSLKHDFNFNEAISFIVNCDTQEEIDHYWEKLSAVPEADLPAPRPDAFYVYVVLCNDHSMYVGQTQDILRRLRDHQAGTAAEHTRKHKPLHIIHYEEFKTREEAVKREHDLKTGFGRKWLKREYKAGRTRQAGQCGWLKDKYGVSWQIVPRAMNEMMASGDKEKIARVTKSFLAMKKFNIQELEKAYNGEN